MQIVCRSNFIVFLFLTCMAQGAVAQVNDHKKESGPVTTMTFKTESFDFGTIDEGEVVERVFTFTNTGTEPLVITDASGSCGCTVPQWPRAPIAPGETASLTVAFDSKGKLGNRNQKVTVTANTDPPMTFLSLTGEVRPKAPGDPKQEVQSDKKLGAERNKSCVVIYPNPTAETLTIDIKENAGQSVTVTILSLFGQVMAERELAIAPEKIEFQVGHYPAGTYFAQIRIGAMQREAKCFVVAK
jgi:hypothetical protein